MEAPDGKIALLEGMATPAWSALLGSGVRLLGDGESKRRFFGISWSSCKRCFLGRWSDIFRPVTVPSAKQTSIPTCPHSLTGHVSSLAHDRDYRPRHEVSKKMKSKKQRNSSEEDEQEKYVVISVLSAQPSGSVLGQKTSLCSQAFGQARRS